MADANMNRSDVWIWDVARGVRTRFTTDDVDEAGAVWSPDGNSLIFNSRRQDLSFSMVQKASSGVGGAQVILADDTRSSFATSWSRDGRFVLFDSALGRTAQRGDLWVLPLDGGGKPIQLTQTPFNELNARFSPEGHWIAYQSDESGRDEIYAMMFVQSDQAASPAVIKPSRRSVVSNEGGIQPRWRLDGKELFYLSGDWLMAVPVKGQGSALEFGTAQRLFQIDASSQQGQGYDVSADGQRFLINKVVVDDRRLTMTVVVNWTAGLSRR
jgi:Tol biopolymer transport system component